MKRGEAGDPLLESQMATVWSPPKNTEHRLFKSETTKNSKTRTKTTTLVPIAGLDVNVNSLMKVDSAQTGFAATYNMFLQARFDEYERTFYYHIPPTEEAMKHTLKSKNVPDGVIDDMVIKLTDVHNRFFLQFHQMAPYVWDPHNGYPNLQHENFCDILDDEKNGIDLNYTCYQTKWSIIHGNFCGEKYVLIT